ncbi:MAG: polysaccharide deacetylase family protein [Phycisphaerales bacterium]|nr:polysaccharide deacetylase family protein [Phycisphaerales bacterium]
MSYQKIILMYHSVGSEAHPAVTGSFPVPLARFIHQLDRASEAGWAFGALSRLHEPVESDTLYITGDDGTADWAANVLPWCEERGIPTHTGLITGPWRAEPIWPVAHRLQILLALPGRKLAEPRLDPEQAAYVDRVYAYEKDERRRRLKGACNVILTDEEARTLLGPPDAEELSHLRARFAAPDVYRGFRHAEFGTHTLSHNAFSGDPMDYVLSEIVPCRRDLEAAGLRDSGFFTLPMRPRYPVTVEQLVPPLREHGFVGVLDGQGAWDGQSFIVPRIDAKNVEEFLQLPAWQG